LKEKEQITEWFHSYGDDVLNFLIYYTGYSDMEDLVQEVFLKAWRKLSTFDNKSSPKTWLFSIARNVAIDEMRKRKKELVKKDKVRKLSMGFTSTSAEEVFSLNETKREIYQQMKSMKKSNVFYSYLNYLNEQTKMVVQSIDVEEVDEEEKIYNFEINVQFQYNQREPELFLVTGQANFNEKGKIEAFTYFTDSGLEDALINAKTEQD
jgi:RNA polymerase sigma-70 factor, ECF subfamily